MALGFSVPGFSGVGTLEHTHTHSWDSLRKALMETGQWQWRCWQAWNVSCGSLFFWGGRGVGPSLSTGCLALSPRLVVLRSRSLTCVILLRPSPGRSYTSAARNTCPKVSISSISSNCSSSSSSSNPKPTRQPRHVSPLGSLGATAHDGLKRCRARAAVFGLVQASSSSPGPRAPWYRASFFNRHNPEEVPLRFHATP